MKDFSTNHDYVQTQSNNPRETSSYFREHIYLAKLTNLYTKSISMEGTFSEGISGISL